MKRIVEILAFLFLFICVSNAQIKSSDSLLVETDTLFSNVTVQKVKTKAMRQMQKHIADTVVTEFKPDPMKVVWMGAIIPGYGQILNHSYWKLPIVYAGFLGCAYAITWNSTRYETYRLAYKDIIDTNDKTNSYLDLLPNGVTIDEYRGGISGLESNLSTAYQQYRRYRDLSIIGAVAYYAIVLVEAYVEAQLFDFDISTDLSLHIRPALLQNNYGVNAAPGVQLSLNLK